MHQKGNSVDPNDNQRCKCGHDLNLHDANGCTAGKGSGRQCSCSRPRYGALALLASPAPRPVSLQAIREWNVDDILGKFWTAQERHQAEHEEQMRILRERRAQTGRKFV